MDSFRPVKWDDYIGQRKLKDTLQIKIEGALNRGEMLEHVLLYGPPGCGKTSISSLVADQMMMDFLSFVMPIKPQIMRKIVQGYEGIVLFDEIHRLSSKQQEELLPLIEDNYLQLENGMRIEAGALTIIGATTELDKIIAPLYDRFHIKPPFDDYTDEEMGIIVKNMADKIGVRFSKEEAEIIGKATGGVPRLAKALVSMARDLETTDPELIFKKSRITKDGLTEMHLRYLKALYDCGGTAGIEIVGTHLSLPKSVLSDLEKLLVKKNMIEYTKQGRNMLPLGYKQIDKKTKFNF